MFRYRLGASEERSVSLTLEELRHARPAQGYGRAGRGSSSLFGAYRRFVLLELFVAAQLVRYVVPAVFYGLHRRRDVDFAGHVAGDRCIEDDLLVALVRGDAQVEDHVRRVERILDGTEIVLGGLLAHSCLGPV